MKQKKMIREQKNNTNCSMGKKMGFANGMKAGGIMSMYNVMYFVCCFFFLLLRFVKHIMFIAHWTGILFEGFSFQFFF